MRPLLLLMLLVHAFTATAQQGSVEKQQLIWLTYYSKAHINKQWSVHTELDGRWFTGRCRPQQWLLPRLHVHYQPSAGSDIGVGAAYVLQALPQHNAPVEMLRPEFRPHQELTLRQQAGKLQLEHRYRLEERFQQKLVENQLVSGWDFSWRFRYRLQLSLPLAQNSRLQPSLKIFDEVMLNAGKLIKYNLFDQNRIGAALSLKVSRHVATELGYLYWFQQRPSGNAFFGRDVFRFTLVHQLFLYPQS